MAMRIEVLADRTFDPYLSDELVFGDNDDPSAREPRSRGVPGSRTLRHLPAQMTRGLTAVLDELPNVRLDPAVVAERIVALLARDDLPVGARVELGGEGSA